jgi:hypothetical protein
VVVAEVVGALAPVAGLALAEVVAALAPVELAAAVPAGVAFPEAIARTSKPATVGTSTLATSMWLPVLASTGIRGLDGAASPLRLQWEPLSVPPLPPAHPLPLAHIQITRIAGSDRRSANAVREHGSDTIRV